MMRPTLILEMPSSTSGLERRINEHLATCLLREVLEALLDVFLVPLANLHQPDLQPRLLMSSPTREAGPKLSQSAGSFKRRSGPMANKVDICFFLLAVLSVSWSQSKLFVLHGVVPWAYARHAWLGRALSLKCYSILLPPAAPSSTT